MSKKLLKKNNMKKKLVISRKKLIIAEFWDFMKHRKLFEPLERSIKTPNVKWFFPSSVYNADIGVGYSSFSKFKEKGWQVEKLCRRWIRITKNDYATF
jgi:hypothetical protein